MSQFLQDDKISYGISQLLDFVDDIADVIILVYDKDDKLYRPHGKRYIKQKIYGLLGFTATNKSGRLFFLR